MDDLVTGSSGITIQPIYALSIAIGIAFIFLFPLTRDFESKREKSQYYYLQLITLLGAVVGAKLAVLMGDALWPIHAFDDWHAVLYSGRSIVGALLFGFIAAEIAKPIMDYRRPPNDRFAILLPFSIAMGRVGCWFAGCCLGLPLSEVVKGAQQAPRLHPIAIYEIAFHVSIGATLVFLFRHGRFKGQLFALFMIAYGTFRFASETVRATEKAFYGLSAYQWLAAMLILAGMLSYSARRPAQAPEVSRGT